MSTVGSEWKFQRKIVAHAFSQKTIEAVHEETKRVVNQMMDCWKPNREGECTIDESCPTCMLLITSYLTQTLAITLHVVSGAAYGTPFDWTASLERSESREMSFRTTLKTIVGSIMLMFVVPIRLMKIIPSTRMKQTYSAYTDFEKELRELIDHERRGDTKHKNDSILRALVQSKDGRVELDDSEIIGNAFVLLLGGYESTYRLFLLQADHLVQRS